MFTFPSLSCEYYYFPKYFRPQSYNPVGIYMFKVNNRNTRTSCEMCSKVTIKTPELRHKNLSDYPEERADFSPNPYENKMGFMVILWSSYSERTCTSRDDFWYSCTLTYLKLYLKLDSMPIFFP